MSYRREIPRDLFNEASLLKCFGQLYLNLEKLGLEDALTFVDHNAPFEARQNVDGAITLENVRLFVRGEDIELWRPLNSRQPYPLYLYPKGYEGDAEEIEVFNDDGSFTDEMKAFLKGEAT